MAKIKRRGESGAAKNYVTRSQALKKLQVTLADFRRLCILKGIYPRDPLHKKRANKGSSAPTSFYYQKDIQYLLHEPLLVKFREHKAFAKKLARALGRGEYALAKNLENAKPVARLDHLVKERYPTFTLALQDLQDPLNLIHLFSNLPTNPVAGGRTVVPAEFIAECSRLNSEWKLWVIKTHALRKVFLSIKGVYYETEVPGHGGEPIRIRWMEGYDFQQHVPHDVDFRILLTFLELYRTLLSFVLYRLYTEENLVYPPPLDVGKDEEGETVGAFRLVERQAVEGAAGAMVSKKEVKRAIKGIRDTGARDDVEMEEQEADGAVEGDDDFVERPTKDENEDVATAPLTTYNTLLASAAPSSSQNLLFSPYTFYLSRETSSRTWEFVIRAMGGRVITSLAAASPAEAPNADSITHVIVDRPMLAERMREMQGSRKWVWVQPQWVADCVNRGKILSSHEYGPGQLLPPHASPWDGEGEVSRPWLEKMDGQVVDGVDAALSGIPSKEANGDAVDEDADEEEEEKQNDEEEDEEGEEEEDGGEEDGGEDEEVTVKPAYPPALLAAAMDSQNPTSLRAAELEAERNGTSHAAFEKQLKEATKANVSQAKSKKPAAKGAEDDLRKIMMSNKKAKLYDKIQHGNQRRQEEKDKLEGRRVAIEKRKQREARSTGRA